MASESGGICFLVDYRPLSAFQTRRVVKDSGEDFVFPKYQTDSLGNGRPDNQVSAREGIIQKRLHRSKDQRTIWGVCGGPGQYFGVDPAIIRVVIAVLTLFLGLTGALVRQTTFSSSRTAMTVVLAQKLGQGRPFSIIGI